ncbi:MAG TPA: hypothetical protein VF194_12935 [Ferrovibrio sp.]|uniref:endonuclease III domain-containing protein n=1 Tax=Ferrovibrio sp. TaxID=1917215 RepID=UPI002ED24F3C
MALPVLYTRHFNSAQRGALGAPAAIWPDHPVRFATATQRIVSAIDNVLVLFFTPFMPTRHLFDRRAELDQLRRRLTARFGPIRDTRRDNPTGQFIHAFIGSRTRDEVSSRVYQRLLQSCGGRWEEIIETPATELAAILAEVTFADQKAPNLKTALRNIRARAGAVDLEFLADLEVEPALFWLEQIHGVGRKIAATTLNFSSLRMRCFVVDTHVWRVLRRFGLVGEQAEAEDVYDAVMEMADDLNADDLYELHWQLKTLGQTGCRHAQCVCTSCCLSELCMKRIEPGAKGAA